MKTSRRNRFPVMFLKATAVVVSILGNEAREIRPTVRRNHSTVLRSPGNNPDGWAIGKSMDKHIMELKFRDRRCTVEEPGMRGL